MTDATVAPIVDVSNLRIDLAGQGVDVVDDVHMTLRAGELLGLVGESGSGKTTVGLALLGHARRGVEQTNGSVTIADQHISAMTPRELRKARGELVSYVPQDPGSALNPARRIGALIMELLESHGFGSNDAARKERLAEVLREVKLPDDIGFQRRYPHQLSGGQQQRVGLAMAFACRPKVIVLDEPTTGLDVSTQVHVLDTIRSLARDHGVAGLYVTHDLAVVANIADRVAVMYAGRIVEEGPTHQIFTKPAHPYTRYLTAAAPDMDANAAIVGLGGRAPAPGQRPVGCAFALRCELADDKCREEFPAVATVGAEHTVRCFHPFEIPVSVSNVGRRRAKAANPNETPALSIQSVDAGYSGHVVVHDATFDVARGECVALVGESGSGKSTLSRSIGGLHKEWTGNIFLNGTELAHSARQRSIAERLNVQYVFQNPYSSLHPRRPVGESIARPLVVGGTDPKQTRATVASTLERVSLTAAYASKYPDQLSGGERQRVAIARAIVSQPDVLICDEVTSALDVLVQATIIELLIELQEELGLAMLFVTHNLPLIASLAQRVAVMSEGRIVELGDTDDVLHHPQESYTQGLLADTPSIRLAMAADEAPT